MPAYAAFVVVEISLQEFRQAWLPGLDGDEIRVGLNWSGPRATGHELLGTEVEANFVAIERDPATD